MTKRNNYEHQALTYSAVLHLLVLLLAIFGLPELWRQHREALPVAMSVEILPIGQTNVKPKEQIKATKDAKNNKPITAPKATSASKSNQPKPKPVVKKEVIPLPDAKKEKPKPKEKEKPKPEPKEEEKPEDLDAILKSVENAAKAEEGKKNLKSTTETKKAVSDDYNPSMPLAMSEIDAIRQQFMQCWNVPAGAKDAHNLQVFVEVRLNSDGTVIDAQLSQGKARYYTDTFFRSAADSAIRAVHMCSPLKNLPTDKYETWKFLELCFDPKDMLY